MLSFGVYTRIYDTKGRTTWSFHYPKHLEENMLSHQPVVEVDPLLVMLQKSGTHNQLTTCRYVNICLM